MSSPPSDDLDPEFFAKMVESVGVGVGIYAEDGKYNYVNEAYADFFGTPRVELIGTPIWEIASDIEQERFYDYWHSFDAGDTRTAETVHQYGGVSVPVATVTTCRTIDGVSYHFGTIKNISERKKRERELERQNERLDAFASVVSHDLRNPLGVAQGYLELLGRDYDREEIVLIDNALDRMDTLISELLSLAKSGDTIGDTEPTPVSEVAKIAWNTVDTSQATLNMTASDVDIVADKTRLQQLFENLFRNAIEHGGRNVTITVGDMDSGFHVADDGVGIPESERDEVLKAGYTTSDDGTGVGLNIVSQIAGAHDWDIHITQSANGGARFEFTTIDPTAE